MTNTPTYFTNYVSEKFYSTGLWGFDDRMPIALFSGFEQGKVNKDFYGCNLWFGVIGSATLDDRCSIKRDNLVMDKF